MDYLYLDFCHCHHTIRSLHYLGRKNCCLLLCGLLPYHKSRGIHRAVSPDFVEMESDLALIAVVGRGMKSQRGTAGRVFSALAHAHVNVKMIDQGSSELNIIIGVENRDFETAVKAIYDIFVLTQM